MFFCPAFMAYPATTVTLPPDKWALAPNYDTNWNQHNYYLGQTGAGSVAQLTDGRAGVSLAGGTQTTLGVNGVALWTANRAARGDFTATFKTKKTDATASFAFETYLLFYFGVSGPGTAAYPTDMAQWPTTTQAQSLTYKNAPITGARVTLYYQKTAQPAESEPVYPAVFPGDSTVTSLTASSNFGFAAGTTYSWTVQLSGNTLTITQTDGVTTNTHTVTDASLSQYAKAGNFGLLATAGRRIDVWDFSVDDGSVGNGTYTNGYSYRRWLRVAGAALGGAARQSLLPIWFDETLPSLKGAAGNGGNVQSSAGWDIRFEIGGVKVAHELEIYDPVAGRAAGWIDGSALVPGVDLDIALYYGNPNVTASEANPAALWTGYLGVWRMPDGNDMLGNGRHLVPGTGAAAPGTGTLLNMPAAVLTQAATFKKADASYLTGKSAFSTVIWHQPSSLAADGMMLRIGGGPGNARHAFWRDHGPDTTADGATFSDYYGGSANFSDGKSPNEYGPTGSAAEPDGTLAPDLIAIDIASGAEPQLWKNGVQLAGTLGHAGSVGSGTIDISSTMDLTLGHNAGNNSNAAAGAYGRVMILPTALDGNWYAFHYLNVLAPHAVYGISDEDAASDTVHSPVMAPSFSAAAVGGSVDVDILAHASDPDGALMTSGLAAPAPTLGTASIVANLVRYARTTAGTDRLGITATVGAKTAKALLTVTDGSVIQPDGDMPVAPKTQRITAWELVQDSSAGASIVEGPDVNTGVHLIGGAVTTNTGANAIGLVSIKALNPSGSAGMVTAPFTVSYEYQRGAADPAVPDPNGIFCQLGFYRRNAAGNANLGSIGSQGATGEWTANYSPTDGYYSNGGVSPSRATGVRFSFDTHSATGSGDNQIRARAVHADGSVVQFNPPTLQTFDFASRTDWTRLDWSVPGDSTVTVTATWPDGTTTTQVFDDPEISSFFGAGTAANVVLLAYANRDARFRKVDIQSTLVGNGVLADYVGAGQILAHGDPSRVDVAAKSDIPSSLAPNHQYTVTGNISFGSAANRDNASNTITVRGGLLNSTCYLRGHNEGADPSLWPELSNGTINIAATSLIIRGLRLRNFCFVLQTGASHVQIESNHISDFYETFEKGIVEHDGDALCDHILIAFNRYSSDVDWVSGPLLNVMGTSRSWSAGAQDACLNHVTVFRNHVDSYRVGPTSGGSGGSRIIHCGRHDDDNFQNLHLLVQENLCTNWKSPGPFTEMKYTGVTFQGNTFEWGVISNVDKAGAHAQKNTPLQIRIRHGRETVDPSTDIDVGRGAVIDGNLWVKTPASSFTGSGVNLRDGFHTVTNNWAVSLADGTQPVAGSAVISGSIFDIQPLSGNLDWNGYPANSTPGGGQNWPNGSKCKVGGNHAAVHVGESAGSYTNQKNPEKCRVAPASGARADRNDTVSIATQTNPDTGVVIGADYSKVPARLRGGPDNGFASDEYDVGPLAWSQSYYGRSE